MIEAAPGEAKAVTAPHPIWLDNEGETGEFDRLGLPLGFSAVSGASKPPS
ncbi:MAG: hypothetical protein AAFR65_08575 [Pseudomonadota bacterium]